MSKSIASLLYVTLCIAVLLATDMTYGQYEPPPEPIIKDVFNESSAQRICGPEHEVEADRLLGEIAAATSINIMSLPAPPPIESGPIANTAAARMAAWIVSTETMTRVDAAKYGLSDPYFEKIDTIRQILGEYVRDLESKANAKPFDLTRDSIPGDHPENNGGQVAEFIFADALGNGRNTNITFGCTLKANNEQVGEEHTRVTPRIQLIARGKIDDLSTPHFRSDNPKKPNPSLAKASEAKIGFTENGAKGERAITAEIALAAGRQLTPNDEILAFLHYTQNSTETKANGDDDDSKDVKAVSPGFLYRHSVGGPNQPIFGTVGFSAFPTFDLAQDSRIFRARVFLSDIAISSKSGPICGIETQIHGPIYYSCRLGVFGEFGKVIDAGRSTDLANDEDDEYSGIGTSIGLSFWLSNPKYAAPFSLNFDYRYMKVFSGSLSNPKRFSAELSYKIPDSNLSISLSRAVGDNSETFQKENINKLTIGYKY